MSMGNSKTWDIGSTICSRWRDRRPASGFRCDGSVRSVSMPASTSMTISSVLIFGASGAVGTLAVQLAKRRGARVIGTARTGEAASVVRELGAEAVVDARSPDVIEQLRAAAPDGLDAVLALAGGPTLERCLDLLRGQGRVAYPNGVEPEPRSRLDVEEARLRVQIAAVYPLEQTDRAHARVEQGHVIGRVVVRVREEQTQAGRDRARR
jgi:NADPH:quinone reductase-like Zn-dependent oxidoreductase